MKYFVCAFVLVGVMSAGSSSIVSGLNDFTILSYRQLDQVSENLILSPFNIATALSMTLSGARGSTATQIAAVLRQRYDASYDSSLASLVARVTKAGNAGGNELLAANGLWVQQGFPIQPAFQKTLADDYHAPLTPLDFVASAESARRQINGWTGQHTKNRIKDLLAEGSVNADTRLVLTSAIYFYGKWQEPFETSRTEPAPFKLVSGRTIQASFMNQTSRFSYTETPSTQILQMRYASTGIAFDVLLPRTSSGLANLEKSLSSENLASWLGNLDTEKVAVTLPKFRSESEFSLRKVLSAMGMPAAFRDDADFSGIDSRDKLWISQVVHKAFVDVSEQGTEAAAATGIAMVGAAMRPKPEQTFVFRADHPFIFMIRDTQTGVILFIGRVMKP